MARTQTEIKKALTELRKKHSDGDMLLSEFEEAESKLYEELQAAAVEEGRKQGEAQAQRSAQVRAQAQKFMDMVPEITAKVYPENPNSKAALAVIDQHVREHIEQVRRQNNTEWTETLMSFSDAQIKEIGDKVVEQLVTPEELKAREEKAKQQEAKSPEKKGKGRDEIAKEKEGDVSDVRDNPRVSGEGAKGVSSEQTDANDEKKVSDWVKECQENPDHLDNLGDFAEVINIADKMNVEEGHGSKILLRGHDGTFRAPDHANV